MYDAVVLHAQFSDADALSCAVRKNRYSLRM